MPEETTENVELEGVSVPNDDMGDLISALFRAGFSDEETDMVLDSVNDMQSMPEGEMMLDEEIMKLFDKFEIENIELSEEDKACIREELHKRFV
ncbi:hypothetical protein C0584_03780 [Candidatus Parcubacteria bacterium]|mgnify:CR=1 FL=1|nr:MAG: hypothetical protein C0584_03780 [Candidatus Parcubacteria bacterium]